MEYKELIYKKINEEIHDKKYIRSVQSVFEKLLETNENPKYFTLYEFSKFLDDEKLTESDIYELIFELSSLSLPIVTIYFSYNNDEGQEFFIQDKFEVIDILNEDNIFDELGNELIFEEYKDFISLYILKNQNLFTLINSSI